MFNDFWGEHYLLPCWVKGMASYSNSNTTTDSEWVLRQITWCWHVYSVGYATIIHERGVILHGYAGACLLFILLFFRYQTKYFTKIMKQLFKTSYIYRILALISLSVVVLMRNQHLLFCSSRFLISLELKLSWN